MKIPFSILTTFTLLSASEALAQSTATTFVSRGSDTGISAIWILANFSFAGMRAQAHPNDWWRFFSFIFGFPGTLISWIFISEGSGKIYGVVISPPKALENPTPKTAQSNDV